MSHLDPEQLALLAMGEPVASEAERAHLASCPACTAEMTQLTHAVVVGRSTMDEADLDTPPARVWGRIHDELGLGEAVVADPLAPAGVASTAEPADDPDALSEGAPDPAAAAAEIAPARPAEAAPDRRRRRSARRLWVLAASLVLVAVVGAGAWVGISSSLAPVSIASASLDAFPSHPTAVGTAEIDESRDGERTLTVTLEGDAESDDYREVWLIRNDGQALISLGVLEGAAGSFPIPAGIDLTEYDLVDISFEPIDGDPNHSGDSIVRGQLSFA
ncbi:anti-sigma factor [Microbacterium sp. M3]|uniref:Anti-sigma factor n=1 Tax=Microbacterium arthrosphaerae TaxID=792652 RepID=A0ABU4GWZ4_9MICO|nr:MULTISPECIES: anti-sigma factor [Microbacterium]MDW4571601.1 anti-sigma factor [Microbacterium arthrosphaerae]MDW7605456.1 anti-sigma factor [Microbacterium sp. M3]